MTLPPSFAQMTTIVNGWVVATGQRLMGMPTILCDHSRCNRARYDPRLTASELHPATQMTAAAAARDVESDLVAALPLGARESAAVYSRWLSQLRHVVATSDGGDVRASPLGLDLAAIVCGYVDALAAETTVLVVAPKPLCAVAALSARLTLGEAWAVMVDAFHEHRCRNASTANADITSPLADVTFETVAGWELSDGKEVELKMAGAPDKTKEDGATSAPKTPKRLPSMAALLQRPLGLFLRQPVRLEFNVTARWTDNKFLSRDVLMTAACTLAGISVHEFPPTAPYPIYQVSGGIAKLSSRFVGVLPGGATQTRLRVLPNAQTAEDAAIHTKDLSALHLFTVSTPLRWIRHQDYVYRVHERIMARMLSSNRAAPLRCPLTDAPMTDAAVNALKKQVLASEYVSVFDPATGVLRPSHWLHDRKLDLHGNWRIFCDRYLSSPVQTTLERLGAAVAFEPATSHWFPRPRRRPAERGTMARRAARWAALYSIQQ